MRNRQRLRGALTGLLLLWLIAGAASPAGPGSRAMPGNIHPAVLAQMATHPGEWVSVIVSKAKGASGLEEAAEGLGARVTARWTVIHAFAAEVPRANLATLANLPGVRAVLSNGPVQSAGQRTEGEGASSWVETLRADRLWDRGITGSGITVAVVDSGIFHGEPATDFAGRLLENTTTAEDLSDTNDEYGHGTHVAGIIGGNGSNSDGKYRGLAPGVNLINVKFGRQYDDSTERDLVEALQWVYDNKDAYNIRVVNISATVGTSTSYTESPAAAAVEQLWLNGIVVVVAAGNHGSSPCATCHAPANDPYVITVGAVDNRNTPKISDDLMPVWSSRGETRDGYAKPDLLAPGAHIISYMPVGSMRESHPENIVDEQYFQMGGTSMAAPMVTGAAALLLQARPDLTPDQVKWLFMKTARKLQKEPAGSAGVVDVFSAYAYDDEMGSANKGLTPSPLLDSASGTISYENTLWGNTLWGNTLWGNADPSK